MMPNDLEDLMLVYSIHGVTDWNQASPILRMKAEECLLNKIATDEGEVESVINSPSTVRKFIPMPRHGPKQRGFDWSFFLPRKKDGQMTSLVLFILVNQARKDSVAFRFESSAGGPHGYSHVQLTSKLPELGLAASSWGVPQWLPASYPAFPIVARNWTEMFLSMMTAVHGYNGGVDDLIKEIFQQAERLNDAQKYMEVLNSVLVKLD